MDRRYFIGGLGALFAGAGTLGTGAFSSTNVSRDAVVQVAKENTAYLALSPAQDSTNSTFATNSADGKELGIDVNDQAGTAAEPIDSKGLNQRATTELDRVFEVQNQGTQAVYIDIDPIELSIDSTDSEGKTKPVTMEFYVRTSTGGEKEFIHGTAGGTGNLPDRTDQVLKIPVGKVRQIGILLETQDYAGVTSSNRKSASSSTTIFADNEVGDRGSTVTLQDSSPFVP